MEKLLAAGADPIHQDKVRNLVTRVMLIHVPNTFVPNKGPSFFHRPIIATGENLQ